MTKCLTVFASSDSLGVLWLGLGNVVIWHRNAYMRTCNPDFSPTAGLRWGQQLFLGVSAGCLKDSFTSVMFQYDSTNPEYPLKNTTQFFVLETPVRDT